MLFLLIKDIVEDFMIFVAPLLDPFHFLSILFLYVNYYTIQHK